MKRLDELVRRFAEAEKNLLQTNFLAPTTGKGKIAVRLPNGAIYFFRAVPNFSGWGIFQPTGIDTLQLVREAHEWERLAYLEALPALRVIAVHALRGDTWLCVAFNRSDARQRNFPTGPFLAHLFLSEVAPLDVVIVRTDGSNWWYDGLDTHYELERSERLRASVQSQLESCLDAPTPLERLKRLKSHTLASVPNASLEESFACELLFAQERRKWEEQEWGGCLRKRRRIF
jgi:hypothetical protein